MKEHTFKYRGDLIIIMIQGLFLNLGAVVFSGGAPEASNSERSPANAPAKHGTWPGFRHIHEGTLGFRV